MKQLIIVITILISGFTNSQSLTDSLLIYYPFTGNAMDVSGNNYHGTSNASLISDRFGNPNSALSFNGINQFVDFPNLNQLKPELPVSFSFWVKYDNLSHYNQVIFNTSFQENISSGVSFNSSASSGSYAVNFGDGSQYFSSSSRRTFVSNQVIETSSWHHIVVIVESATNMTIYVDCRDLGGNYSGSGDDLYYSNTPGSLGRHDQNTGTVSAYHFKGYLDDFRYYNRALTADNIMDLCNEQTSSLQNDTRENIQTSVFPNPVKDVITINSKESFNIKNIVLYNAIGKIVYQGDFKNKLNIDFLDKGLYFLHLLDGKSKSLGIQKIIKE